MVKAENMAENMVKVDFQDWMDFKEKYDAVCDSYADLKNRVKTYSGFFHKGFSDYVGEKLFPVMFSNLVKTHSVILKDYNGSYSLIATPKGLRLKYGSYGTHTQKLPIEELHFIFSNPQIYGEVEKWFVENTNRKRVAVLRNFKKAFDTFKPEWLQEKDEQKKDEQQRLFSADVDKQTYAFDKQDGVVNIKRFNCRKVALFYDLSNFKIAFLSSKFKEFDEHYPYNEIDDINQYVYFKNNKFFEMFPFADLLNEVLAVIDMMTSYLDGKENEVQKWFAQFKQDLSAYTSLISL